MHEDNEFLELPNDPEEAFVALVNKKYGELEDILKSSESDNGYHFQRRFVNTLLAFDEVHDLGFLSKFKNPPSKTNDFYYYFHEFSQAVEKARLKIQIETARRLRSGSIDIVLLDASSRSAIHALIEQIRVKLNELKLSENKRESLFNKLNAFASEVDRNRTRTESFNSFVVGLTTAVKDDLGPIKQTVDRVLDYLDRAKKLTESLPPWSERKKIEGPQKQLPAPTSDDEIPF